eukprot:COSAG01_NODE_2021_length_8633_cov_363.046403_4_plen_212_part_00
MRSASGRSRVSPLPAALRSLSACAVVLAAKKKEKKAASLLFHSVIHHSPLSPPSDPPGTLFCSTSRASQQVSVARRVGPSASVGSEGTARRRHFCPSSIRPGRPRKHPAVPPRPPGCQTCAAPPPRRATLQRGAGGKAAYRSSEHRRAPAATHAPSESRNTGPEPAGRCHLDPRTAPDDRRFQAAETDSCGGIKRELRVCGVGSAVAGERH